MNNRRPILFFVVGTLLLGGLLVWLEMRARQAVPDERGGVLCEFMPERVDACFIQRGQDEVDLAREADGTWWPEEKVLKTLAELPKPAPQQTDFIDSCVNRKTFALNESNGFRSSTMFNLAIVAWRLGRGFEFDPVTLHAKNDEAAERFLYQDDMMREPWRKEMFG